MSNEGYSDEYKVVVDECEISDDGVKCHRETWINGNGVNHRDHDLPDVVYYDQETGKVVQREWHDEQGRLHRDDDKPAIEMDYDLYGVNYIEQHHFRRDVYHRDGGGPAVIKKSDGEIDNLEYWYDGLLHRDHERPARMTFGSHDANMTIFETYFLNGREHRTQGPSHINRDNEKNIICEERYCQHGKPFREGNLPVATSRCFETGKTISEEYADGTVIRHGKRIGSSPNDEPSPN